MIIDTLENASLYYSVHPLFQEAFNHVAGLNLESLEEGKSEISNGLFQIVAKGMGKTNSESLKKFECHNKNIDIQIVIDGVETFGWKPRATCIEPNGEYNDEKDVLFYNDAPDMYFQLQKGQFVILFPNDVHAPMIGEGEIGKMVLKVKIDD